MSLNLLTIELIINIPISSERRTCYKSSRLQKTSRQAAKTWMTY